jgi:threonine/homoserine/homoserine lactone efflux protein
VTLDGYLLFIAGSVLLVIIPGPDMIYLLARSVAQGRRAGLMAALGFNLGAYCHLAAALLGVSALLAASPRAFTAVKWLGAAYLVFLGVQALATPHGALTLDAAGAEPRSMRVVLRQAFLSDLLNPKVGMFFLAFLPQFVAPDSPHRTLQLVMLGVTVNMIALAINIPLVFVATGVSARLRGGGAARHLAWALGVVFISLGVRIALT